MTVNPGFPMLREAALFVALTCSLALAGCGKKPTEGMQQAPVEVKAVTVTPSATLTYADKVGEVRGSQEVDLRARVSGILLEQHFTDGALVQKGQPLFSIDAREFRAQVANARARLASAEANRSRARQDVARYEPLLADEAISRQIYDDAVAAAQQAQAEVNASRAALEETELGLEYAEVRAPLSGRIGATQVFPGGLVTAGQTLLATLSSDDPAWVYFSITEGEWLAYERKHGGAEPAADDPVRTVHLLLGDGSMYPLAGRISFRDRAIDPTMGTYRLRAEFPNPDHLLLPGLFVRVRLSGQDMQNALIVPDRAVQEQLGRYFVTVVAEGEKAEMRPVQLGARFGNRQVIQSGLTDGDRVVVEGLQKARPGSTLKVTAVTLEDFDRPASPGTTPGAGSAAATTATTITPAN
jgi:membrane fusion protein, multidrug efflux system